MVNYQPSDSLEPFHLLEGTSQEHDGLVSTCLQLQLTLQSLRKMDQLPSISLNTHKKLLLAHSLHFIHLNFFNISKTCGSSTQKEMDSMCLNTCSFLSKSNFIQTWKYTVIPLSLLGLNPVTPYSSAQ